MGKPFIYNNDKYVPEVPYTTTQPAKDRKLGFGSKDGASMEMQME